MTVHPNRPRKIHYAAREDGYGRIATLCHAGQEPAHISKRNWTRLAERVTCHACIASLESKSAVPQPTKGV